jgi:hypothetical protein
MIVVALLAMVEASTSAGADRTKSAGGMIINFGLVPAGVALRADGHRDAHPLSPPPGSQHLLITLDNERTGKRIGDAEVVVEVVDPKGHVEKKALLHTQAGGLPDYSDLFRFEWSGTYSIRVIITSRLGSKPIETKFTVHHVI